MDKEKTPQTDNTAKIAELETKIALLTSEAEKQKEVIETYKKDNQTLLNLNKQLQLAVGVTKGDDAPVPPPQEEPKPEALQDALVGKLTKKFN